MYLYANICAYIYCIHLHTLCIDMCVVVVVTYGHPRVPTQCYLRAHVLRFTWWSTNVPRSEIMNNTNNNNNTTTKFKYVNDQTTNSGGGHSKSEWQELPRLSALPSFHHFFASLWVQPASAYLPWLQWLVSLHSVAGSPGSQGWGEGHCFGPERNARSSKSKPCGAGHRRMDHG